MFLSISISIIKINKHYSIITGKKIGSWNLTNEHFFTKVAIVIANSLHFLTAEVAEDELRIIVIR